MSKEGSPQNGGAAARKKEEFSLAMRFINAANRKLDQLTMRGESTNFKLEKAETKLLMEINNTGLLQGAAAGILTFVVLRRIRAGFLRRLEQQVAGKTHNPSGTPPHAAHKSPFQQQKPPVGSAGVDHTAATAAEQQMASIAQGVRNRRTSQGAGGTIFNIMSWLIDGTVSFYVAVAVSLRNPDEILLKVAELPLMEGRSRIADELCPEFVQELRSIQEDSHKSDGTLNAIQKEALQNPQTASLKALLRFCHNCQQRAAYEKLLRQENGLGPDAPVAIPSPGVPHNEIPTKSKSAAWGDDEQPAPQETDFYGPGPDENSNASTNDDDWADAFVADQEEQQKEEERRQGKK